MSRSRLRVGINLMPIPIKGAEKITRHLVGLLEAMLIVDSEIEYICYASPSTGEVPNTPHPRVKSVILRSRSNELAARAVAGEVDVVLGAALENDVNSVNYPTVMLVSDMQFSDHPAPISAEEMCERRRILEWPARLAQRVIVISQDARNKAIDTMGISGESIIVVHPSAIKLINKTVSPESEPATGKKPDKISLESYSGAADEVRSLIQGLYDARKEFQNPTEWHWEEEYPDPDTGPMVSIITPSFQHASYIEETINSVLSQSYTNIELIVIDGGSTDGTVEILKRYGDRIRWISEADNGQADAVNKGLSMARGEIIGWLNSDDTYLQGAISKAVAALSKKSGCWLVYGEGYYTDINGKVIERYLTETFSVENLLRYCIICQPTVFFNKRLLQQQGDLDIDYHMTMDYELWLRYSKITPFLYIPEYLATYRMHPESKTSKFRMRSIKESIAACRRNYRRSSLSWCTQYATIFAGNVPWLGRLELSRRIILRIVLFYMVARNIFPYYLRKSINRLRRGIVPL